MVAVGFNIRFGAAWWTSESAVWRNPITAGVFTADSTLMVGQGVQKAPFAGSLDSWKIIVLPMPTHTRSHTLICAHTQVLARTHAHTHIHTCIYTHTYSHTHLHASIRRHTHSHMHTHMLTHMLTNSNTHTHKHTHAHIRSEQNE